MTRIAVLLVFAVAFVTPISAKDNNTSLEDAIRDELRDDNDKGQGRPDNPGEHGRKNAARKQCENPGKGSKCEGSWEDILDDTRDDHDKGEKNKDKKNKKK